MNIRLRRVVTTLLLSSAVIACASSARANVRTDKPMQASSERSEGFSAWDAADANPATSWVSAAGDARPWIQIDLERSLAVARVELVARQDVTQASARQYFEISGSDSASRSGRRTVLCTRGAAAFAHRGTFLCDVKGRSFRSIRASKTRSGEFSIAELRVIATTVPTTVAQGFVLPPFPAKLDYQLGGSYAPAADVAIVTRDRTEPSAGRYDICYVNGFQAQPDALPWWNANHPSLILRTPQGAPVMDPEWNEAILDISTDAKRAELAVVVGGWVGGCKSAGYEAVELDNLDTYTRFPAYLTQADALDMANRLITISHGAALAVGQKNSAELLAARPRFDFAVVEQCSQYNECGAFFGAYGNNVLVIEYQQAAFNRLCQQFPGKTALFADVNLVPKGQPAHRRQYC